jgi:superfamily II DNA/RNA helicase
MSAPTLPPSTLPARTLPSFDRLGLPVELVRSLTAAGITQPFPVQAATIPDALAGRDVLGRGRTGSGKTLAFGLPLLARTAADGPRRAAPRRPYAMVLAPTRELALQVTDALRPHASALGLFLTPIVGGASYEKQFAALDRGVHLVVATPGRLADLVERKAVDLAEVRIAVLDEADQMADVGFLPEVCALLDLVSPGGQRLLFSATLDRRIESVVKRYLLDPVEHSTDPVSASVPDMAHHVLAVAPHDKVRVITEIAARKGRTLLFARSRAGVERVTQTLTEAGIGAAGLHGGMSQGLRNRTLAGFKDGESPVLVATDVAARGIHVDGIDLVLHVDPPADSRDYLHRAGRTARAGEDGKVVTLAQPKQLGLVRSMLRQAGVTAEAVKVRPGHRELAELTGARDPDTAADELRAEADVRRAQAQQRRREAGPRGSGRSGHAGSRPYGRRPGGRGSGRSFGGGRSGEPRRSVSGHGRPVSR